MNFLRHKVGQEFCISGWVHVSKASRRFSQITEKYLKPIYRSKYEYPKFKIPSIDLVIDIQENCTIVKSLLTIQPLERSSSSNLHLNGHSNLNLISVKLDGRSLENTPEQYQILKGSHSNVDNELVIASKCLKNSPEFKLETLVKIVPERNTHNMGLYYSNGIYSTQCEPIGFREITYFMDRPDIMSKYKVRIEADKVKCPLLLSNGNLVESGDIIRNDGKEATRHYATYIDPYPKPCYLFALVAGDLSYIQDSYTTGINKRLVKLFIYSKPDYVDRLKFAMDCLKLAMKWDEEKFGLEYDLDIFNIVAVDYFNFGAMENKSLNIFNVNNLLFSEELSTDSEFENILGIVGHEYFHNYTGNRVTCRDWFQLTLKEGLTVYRDQEFSSEFLSKIRTRIGNIRYLRSKQFLEDSSPLAHSIRPNSVMNFNNIYSSTVYQKGAEVVRMYATILGKEGFRKGMDLYFNRHDGQAVTCDDFHQAMADANNVDLTQFKHWYDQCGTPKVQVELTNYDRAVKRFSITLSQNCDFSNIDTGVYKPLYIPIVIGLLSRNTGQELLRSTIVVLDSARETFTFNDIEDEPIASILREFSAPVKLKYKTPMSDEDLYFIFKHDTDYFNRFESIQNLYKRFIEDSINDNKRSYSINHISKSIFYILNFLDNKNNSKDFQKDLEFCIEALTLPSYGEITADLSRIDVDQLIYAKKNLQKSIAKLFSSQISDIYHKIFMELSLEVSQMGNFMHESGCINHKVVTLRRLNNILLSYISAIDPSLATSLASMQFHDSKSMTSKLGALSILLDMGFDLPQTKVALRTLYELCNDNPISLNKFFAIQASSSNLETCNYIEKLAKHTDFIREFKNPDRFRSLVGTFANNFVVFHNESGDGYLFVANMIINIDKFNPSIAASTARAFSEVHKISGKRNFLMKKQLERILKEPALSKDTKEIIGKILVGI
ncbi:peptidase family M1 [Cryptosporidium andersoni]|uniref:Peptidase family M1 n=1 Tax=Cryptosporidium andersoni TaxID=117008 RepID=A0A1J4MSP7_9CRYT|nr:peptidase family M1 [Cryptosporidium andersoni]